jgi:hypothetical protein
VSAGTAETVHLLILSVGLIAWIVGLLFHRASFHRPDPMHPEVLRQGELVLDADRHDDLEHPSERGVLTRLLTVLPSGV